MIENSTSRIDRKVTEAQFHDELRGERSGDERYQSNQKYYDSFGKSSQQFVKAWIGERCQGKKVLDYCCGNGEFTRFLAEQGADACGIDISAVSVDNARKAAERQGLANCAFEVMDAEATEFPDNYFDYAHVDGVLHHLDLATSYRELARILKPDGAVICREALKHNPVFHLYRKLTPHLRTAWEVDHILGKMEIYSATGYFDEVRVLKCFNLLRVAAMPVRNTPAFKPADWILENVDNLLLRLPVLKWQAWMAVFLLAKPKRPAI